LAGLFVDFFAAANELGAVVAINKPAIKGRISLFMGRY
jgi:hypothetical protein